MLSETGNVILAAILLPLFLQLGGLVVAILSDAYLSRRHRFALIIVTILTACLVIQNIAEFLCDEVYGLPFGRLIASVVGYSIRPLIIVMFLYIVESGKNYLFAWILIIVNTLIHLTAFFTDICFTITDANHYVGGPLSNACMIISAVLLIYLLVLTVKKFIKDRKYDIVTPFLTVVLIMGTVMLDYYWNDALPVDFLTIAVVSCCVFFYVWLHLQFVREHEKDLMAGYRIKMMMSQIKPHFMYNTLSSIQALCHIDPEKAADTTEKFGAYLRSNIDSLSLPGLIPFSKELEHTKVYADIEKTRFPSIRVEYDIRDKDFNIPPLTVQPMVENAIRHGIRIREEGVVSVSTVRKGDIHEIMIRDNGTGFDVKTVDTIDTTHIGIRNVRERIAKMCGGTFDIESVPDKGTTITIRIPDMSKEA